MNPSPLANKWVLITGASSGFGAATARAFAAAGAKLILGARREDKLEQVAAQARQAGSPRVEWRYLDVASTPSVESFVNEVEIFTEHLDVLVNNAGGAHGIDPVAEARDEDWEAMVQSNLLGLLRTTRALLPLLRNTPGSYIINVGSVAGHQAYEGGACYCGVKAAELQITRALRLELCQAGVRVGTVDPGLAETEFSLVRFKGDAAKAKAVYEGLAPLTAEDVAETILWMASRPPHVCIDELVIKCTAQAAVHKVNRQKPA